MNLMTPHSSGSAERAAAHRPGAARPGRRRVGLLRNSTFRLALLYMVLFGASVLLLLGFIYWSTAAYMARETDATIQAEIAGLAERYRMTGLAGLTGLIAERTARNPFGSSIYLLTDSDYTPIVGNLEQWPEDARKDGDWLSFNLEHRGPAAGAGGHRARARDFDLQGGFHLLVGRNMHDLDAMQATIVNTLAWGLAITLVLGLVGGTMMTRSMARRIEAINQTSREIMVGDLSRRIPTRGTGDDFDQLAENLNDMLDQIEMLMDGVRQVSDNIAHDLRTPLARLRSQLDMVREERPEPDRYRAIIDQAVEEADSLLSTFNALLRIARIESGSRRAGFTEVDLDALLRDVVELYEPLAEEREQSLVLESGPARPVRGDRDLLFQAFANLLDNAVKHTPAGGGIRVRTAAAEGGGSRVVISDEGPGIPEQAREKVFERFYRLETSRSTPGNGLGLSLVAAVARLHGAGIRLEDNAPGLRVVLTLAGTRSA